ncbi:SRPBCC family protein [Flavobacterium taihuense]|uniref:SRPBCC family protein n=1 Tax=Flavobacterium taihuense TaxID=2857508 RepID=A0ABS6XSN8_9FLAO|nr:SRPBCC family protein [Flavobacterium taihuense]MBW4359634.1 SRPBCC family protein [Flavobacterium taihuense]
MKILKVIGLGIVSLIALLLIIPFFISNDYTVSVSTTINKPKQVVFDYVKLVKNQENYSIWVMQDPNVNMVYQGVDGTVGFKASWDSKDDNVGAGSQQITAISEDKIDVDLHFERPMKRDDKVSTLLESVSINQTKVTSKFYGHCKYPMNLMIFIGEIIIKDAETQNLANLKKDIG